MSVYGFADFKVDITPRFGYSCDLLEPYKINDGEVSDFSATASDEDIGREYEKDESVTLAYRESLCILRNISRNLLLTGNGFLFHASVVAYKNEAYAFTAASGTGKSTVVSSCERALFSGILYVGVRAECDSIFESSKIDFLSLKQTG